jgi:hypothetical protein
MSNGYSKQMCVTVAFWFTIPCRLLSGQRLLDGTASSIKIENEMGGACSAYARQERCIQGFGGETWETQA